MAQNSIGRPKTTTKKKRNPRRLTVEPSFIVLCAVRNIQNLPEIFIDRLLLFTPVMTDSSLFAGRVLRSCLSCM